MKCAMKTTLVSLFMLAGSASMVQAAIAPSAGHGTVTFEGSIIEAACSISPESVDQTVNLGQVAKSQLNEGGKSAPETFYIKLVGCDVATLKHVTSTFTGAESSTVPGALGIVGTANGAGIMMTDGAGATVVWGTPTTKTPLNTPNTQLQFGAYLQGAAADGAVVPGEFTAITNFSLAYQ